MPDLHKFGSMKTTIICLKIKKKHIRLLKISSYFTNKYIPISLRTFLNYSLIYCYTGTGRKPVVLSQLTSAYVPDEHGRSKKKSSSSTSTPKHMSTSQRNRACALDSDSDSEPLPSQDKNSM